MARLGALLGERDAGQGAPSFEPPEVFPLARDDAQTARAAQAVERGEELLGAGRVGFLLVAGGQASRLGYDGPKGCFPVGPVTGRPLFEILARRLRAARERHGVATPWYVMTSPANDAVTRAFFAEHQRPCGITLFLGLGECRRPENRDPVAQNRYPAMPHMDVETRAHADPSQLSATIRDAILWLARCATRPSASIWSLAAPVIA